MKAFKIHPGSANRFSRKSLKSRSKGTDSLVNHLWLLGKGAELLRC